MKTKKILTTVSSVVMAATLGVSPLAGCNGGDSGHSHAYQIISVEDATCVAEGKKTLKCACGDIQEEIIPVDPAAHEYGEWEVTKLPNESEKGTAEKTCELSASHKETLKLPMITEDGTGYVSSPVTQAPTSISTGVRHFVYVQDGESVAFDITLPKRNVETMEDAIILGTSLHGLIRESSGKFVSGNPDDPDYTAVVNTFKNYYGEDYTHISSSDQQEEYWYSLDSNGNPFGIFSLVERQIINPLGPDEMDEEGNALDPDYVPIYGNVPVAPRLAENASEDDLKGYGYASGGGMKRTYGAEDTLLTYYRAAIGEGSVKYNYEFAKDGDEYVGSFTFSRMESPHFCRYKVEFTMYENYAIKTLKVETKIIRNWMLANSFDGKSGNDIIFAADGDIIFGEIYPLVQSVEQYETAVDEDGEEYIVTNGVKTAPDGTVLKFSGKDIVRPVPLGWKEGDNRSYYYEKGDKIYAINSDGEVYDTGETYETDHPYVAVRTLEFEEQVLKTEDDVVEPNPYPADDLYLSGFDIKYGGKVIEEDERVEINADEMCVFAIDNVLPNGLVNLSYDPLQVYLVIDTNEILLNHDISQNAFHIMGYFDRTTNSLRIRAQRSGEVDLIVRSLSGSYEKPLKLNVRKGAPSELNAEIYAYSDADGRVEYNWEDYEYKTTNVITLYVGQTLYTRAAALESEKDFVNTDYTSSVGKANESFIALEDNQPVDGGYATKITALAPSDKDFVVYLDSVITVEGSPVAGARLRIKVVDAPSVDDMFTGEYTGRFSYIKMVKTDRNPSAANVSLTFNPTSASDKTHGTVNIVVSRGNQSETCVYSYSYNVTTHKLTCSWVSGRGDTSDDTDETFQFGITLNEVYKLSITHPQGFPGRTETIVLSRPQ